MARTPRRLAELAGVGVFDAVAAGELGKVWEGVEDDGAAAVGAVEMQDFAYFW